jgi:hypothetical protein
MGERRRVGYRMGSRQGQCVSVVPSRYVASQVPILYYCGCYFITLFDSSDFLQHLDIWSA